MSALNTVAVTPPAPSASTVPHPVASLPTAPVTVTSTVLRAVSTALLGGGPGAPGESPAMWVLAAASRRQSGQTAGAVTGVLDPIITGQALTAAAAANQAPVVKYTAGRPNSTTGVVKGRVTATDKDRDSLTYTGPVNGVSAKGGDVVVDGRGRFTYAPDTAARHTAADTTATADDKVDTFTVIVDDGHGGVVPATVTVKIGPVNAKPGKPTATDVSTDLDSGEVTGHVLANDADLDPLTYAANPTRKGSITFASDGTFTYTPTDAARTAAAAPRASASAKSDTFTVTVDDGHGGKQTLRVTVDVAPLGHDNQPPTDIIVTVGQPNSSTGTITGSVSATDSDGDTLTYGNPTGPSNTWTTISGATVTVDPATGDFSYTPEPVDRLNAYSHPDQRADGFDVTISDGHNPAQLATVSVTIDPTAVAVIRTVAFPNTYQDLVVGQDGTVATRSYGTVEGSTVTTLTVTHPDGTTTSRVINANPVFDGPRVGADGTVVAETYVSDSRVVTATVIHPDGSITTSEPIVTDASNDLGVDIGSDGSVALSNVTGDGTTADPYITTITVIHPEGTIATSAPIAGRPYGPGLVDGGGTVFHTALTDSGNPADPFATTITIIHPDGSVVSTPLAGVPRDPQLGADGTFYIAIGVADGDQGVTTLTAVDPDGTIVGTSVTGSPLQLEVGADGTKALTTQTRDGSHIVANTTVFHPDGTVTNSSLITETFGVSGAVGADGTVARSLSLGPGAAANPSTVTVTAIRPDGTSVTSSPISGGDFLGRPLVGSDGTVVAATYLGTGTANDPHTTTVAVIHPDDSVTTTVVAAYPFGVATMRVGGDGSVYVTHGSEPGQGYTRTTLVTVIHPDGATTDVQLDGHAGTSGIGADGNFYQAAITAGGYALYTIGVADPPTTAL